MKLSDVLDSDGIFLDRRFNDYLAVIDFAAEKVADRASVSKATVKDVFMQRENLGTTFLGHQLAIPHGYLDGVHSMVVAFIRCTPPVSVAIGQDSAHIRYVFGIL